MAAGKKHKKAFFTLLLGFFVLILGPGTSGGDRHIQQKGTVAQGLLCPLTPSQEYAGELLAYLLKVVLGRAGNPGSREEWKNGGIHQRLDLNAITRKMTDPEENISDVMVMDSNILALSRVVYYYDHRLSLHKNRDSDSSIYPSPELLGIRLLLLKKLANGEKINLSALVHRERKILNKKNTWTPDDLAAVNLAPNEMELVRDIIHREPHYFQYLKCPFLVNALHEVGAIQSDAFTEEKIRGANYRKYLSRPPAGPDKTGALRIAMLPSITREFYREEETPSDLPPFGFKPTPFFVDMTQRLRRDILARTKQLAHEAILKQEGGREKLQHEPWEDLWKRILREQILFSIEDQRPLVISPGNAARITGDLRPAADFAVIILGKNVYLSLDIQERDCFPQVNRLYVDIMDIKHAQTGDHVDQVSRFIVSRLRDYLMTF